MGRDGHHPYKETKCCRLRKTTARAKNGAHRAQVRHRLESVGLIVGSIEIHPVPMAAHVSSGVWPPVGLQRMHSGLAGGLQVFKGFWWTWSGSNRRPLPCHLRNINRLRTLPPETKDLARGLVDSGGRHGVVLRRLDSTRTPGLPRTGWHVACFPARAVAGCSICCLPKETTVDFHIRMMPTEATPCGFARRDRIKLGCCGRPNRPVRRSSSLPQNHGQSPFQRGG